MSGRSPGLKFQHLYMRSQSGSSALRFGCSSRLGAIPSESRRNITGVDRPANGSLLDRHYQPTLNSGSANNTSSNAQQERGPPVPRCPLVEQNFLILLRARDIELMKGTSRLSLWAAIADVIRSRIRGLVPVPRLQRSAVLRHRGRERQVFWNGETEFPLSLVASIDGLMRFVGGKDRVPTSRNT